MSRTIVCPTCKKEWDFRKGFAHESLYRHKKECKP
jgi:predicted  nucleic acid-binding Zn ribbon protein